MWLWISWGVVETCWIPRWWRTKRHWGCFWCHIRDCLNILSGCRSFNWWNRDIPNQEKKWYYLPMISTISTVLSDGNGLFKTSWEKKKITYKDLRDDVALFAGALKKQGVNKGDRVIIYSTVMHRWSWTMYGICANWSLHWWFLINVHLL